MRRGEARAFQPDGVWYTAGTNNFHLNHAVSFVSPEGRAGAAVATAAEVDD